MKTYASIILLLCAALSAQEKNVPPPGWTAMFSGTDLSGWRGRPHLDPQKEAAMGAEARAEKQAAWDRSVREHWRVEDGAVVNDGKGVYLTTKREYGDFELLIDYRTVALADSGIYLRCNPQVQIWDTTRAGGKWEIGADKGSGGLWNNERHARMPLAHADRPFGEWNRLRIRMVGSVVSVRFNGQLTVDDVIMENYFDRSRPIMARGPVQLQTHGGEIRWRNIFIREISPKEANQILMDRRSAGFAAVFNGKDLTGWTGAVEHYEVVQGAIRCRKGRGGTVHTKAEYENFAARLEFKLPPGGNNGLAIRYPGKGDAAYDGMCEVQVLDNTHQKYAKLKSWQYHGSIYGMVPAHRGYLRPPGSWNFEEVTVKGSTITVELNGFVITEADLAKIEKPASGRKHPGRMRQRGHFGFAGHGDPVEFRKVKVKTL